MSLQATDPDLGRNAEIEYQIDPAVDMDKNPFDVTRVEGVMITTKEFDTKPNAEHHFRFNILARDRPLNTVQLEDKAEVIVSIMCIWLCDTGFQALSEAFSLALLKMY